jgi:dienelactone hydrolase
MLHRSPIFLATWLASALVVATDPLAAQSRIQWNEVPWSGGTLNVALVRPAAGTSPPHPVVFALPWGAGTAELVQTFIESYWLTEPASRGYYVVAPEVRGSTLEQTADEVVPLIFAWMDAELDFDPERVALVGASNGGRGAFFAALSQPDRFQAIMTLPGQYGGPAEDLAVLAGKPLYFMVGQMDDRWVEMTDATRAALETQGIPSALWVAPGQGHVLRMDPRVPLDWIDFALRR